MDLQRVIDAFRSKGYEVSYFPTKEEAAAYLDAKIDGQLVGFGDSETLNALELYRRLSSHNQVWDPQHRPEGMTFNQVAKKCLIADIFFTSVNAAAETGELVNIDSTGNRVAGSLFGHDRVYFVLGTNKIAPTVEDAVWRARNIASPRNAKRLGRKTPCAVNGDKCYDCSSPERICRGLVVLWGPMKGVGKTEVVIVDEELGY